MTTVITHIYYCIAQGEATQEDWLDFADYAEERLHETYPEADISILLVNQDADAGLLIETRPEYADDAPSYIYQARQEAEAFVGRLWDDFGRQTPGRY